MQALMSGYLCGIYLVTAILIGTISSLQKITIENIAVSFLATTFLAFVLMMYELRFLGLIFRIQRPERPVNRLVIRPPTFILRRGNGTPQNTPATTAVNTPA